MPGALARLSGALAELGANIVGIEIHDMHLQATIDGTDAPAIDELAVQVPANVAEEDLVSALTTAGARSVDVRPATPRPVDTTIACFETSARLLRAAKEGNMHRELVLAAAKHVEGTVAWVIEVAANTELFGAAGRAAREGVPVVERGRGPGSPEGARGAWVVAVPDMKPATRILLARRKSPTRFSTTEIERMQALLRCAIASEHACNNNDHTPATTPQSTADATDTLGPRT